MKLPVKQTYKTVNRNASPREQIADLLERATITESPLKEQYQLEAAHLLISEDQAGLAEELLGEISAADLPENLKAEYAIAKAKVHRDFGENDRALRWVRNPQTLRLLSALPIDRQLHAAQVMASLFALVGDHLEAAEQRILIDGVLPKAQQQANRDGIWKSLTLASVEELQAKLNETSKPLNRGWLELAIIAKDNQIDIDAQLSQLENWQSRWNNHPAAQALPGGLANMRQVAEQRARNIALLLPVTGKFANYGKAIRDGFLATWFEGKRSGSAVPQISVYDTAGGLEIRQLYDQAVGDGNELVIGPLTKTAVTNLARSVSYDQPLTAPVLALNRIQGQQFPDRFYQFGLNPEDEAEQIAEIAYNEGHRRALIMVPNGDWGFDIAENFNLHWQTLGGNVIDTATFGSQKDFARVIKDTLNLNQSNARLRDLKRFTRDKIEFTPRRRNDFDFIFLVARPKEARLIKPLMAYHYAGKVPVYSTSRVYVGSPNPNKNKDLNGIKFTEIPWVLENDIELKQVIQQHIPKSRTFQRMYALGADTYRLYPRLSQMAALPNSRVYGETGTLRLNNQKQVMRDLLLAQFQKGHAVNIPIVDASLQKEFAGENNEQGYR